MATQSGAPIGQTGAVIQEDPPSIRRVTAADVARRSGVSRATVSYVLNNVSGQTIPAATQERVRAAAAELGYVPSAAAASLRRGHSRIVLVVTEPALSGFVTEPFLAAITERLSVHGHTPLTYQFSTEAALRALIGEVRPYGVLALTALSPAFMTELRTAGVPRVYSSAHGDPAFPRPWEEEIGAMQAQHLLGAGATALIYAAPHPDNPRTVMARSREIGVANTSTAAGLPSPTRIELTMDRDHAAATLRDALAGHDRPGICAFDDEVAAVTLSGLQSLTLHIPEDALVIG
ncbi:LacI family DNA-binding transcriptional regulator, partial [Phytoactinopolyspora endophytica]|uniref:LacI family DNA-binding transcriptional regulator n=1 Tax=Phytoactinopolyspora endophytica TaxID=1642495 RepID=UPI0013EB872D